MPDMVYDVIKVGWNPGGVTQEATMATIARFSSILIPSGTIVQRDDSKLITLVADVYVDAEYNAASGCYNYSAAGRQWCVSRGCVAVQSETIGAMRYKDGLVTFI
jgi:hypothetical protein